MGKKTELLQLPTRMLAVELGSQKRWRKVALFGGIGAVVVGGLVFAVVRAADSRSAATLEAAWTDLNACMLGPALKDGETPAMRASAVQLAVVGMAKDKRGKPGEAPWPSSCANAAYTLAENAGSAEKGEALKASADALAKALKEDANATTDLAPMVEKLWADAKASNLKLSATPAKGPVAPAVASVIFTRDQFAAVPKFLSGNFVLSDVREQASSAPPRLRFLIDSKDAAGGPALCTAAPGDTTIKCVKVPAEPAKMSPGLSLGGSTEDRAQPFYFAGDRGQLGIFPPNGDKIVAAVVSPGAVSRADGSFLALAKSERGKDIGLVVAPPTGAATTRPLLSGADVDSGLAGLFWEWLVYKGPARNGPAKLFAKKVGKDGPEGAPIEIGNADDPAPSNEKEAFVVGCHSDDGMAVRVAGGTTDTIALYAGGRWAAPMKTATRGGALTCRGVEAVSTSVQHAVENNKNFPIIRQAKCSASGCNTTVLQVREMLGAVSEIAPNDAAGISAADVNGKLLVVWNGGGTGGLRMRFAPADRIKDAEDIVITDGRDATGSAKATTLTEVRVISASTYGVILVGTTAGVRALVVDGSGAVKAAQSSL